MDEKRLRVALQVINRSFPGLVPTVALEHAIQLLQVEAVDRLTEAVQALAKVVQEH